MQSAVLRRRCINYWRHQRASPLVAVDLADLEAAAPPQEPEQERGIVAQEVARAVAELPGCYRKVVWLRYWLGCSVSEAAARAGYRPASARKAAGRALGRLRATHSLGAMGG
jgi:RNA polymerase sigma factor (sigma-70 family)